MLRKLIKAARGHDTATAAPVDYPLEIEGKLGALHTQAPTRKHLDILYGDVRVGDAAYVDLYFRCLEKTGTAVTPFNIFQRFQTRFDLLRYFNATRGVPGACVECGAYRGATALLMCHSWRALDPAFRGRGMYLIDSFGGTRGSTAEDLIPVRDGSGEPRMEGFFPPGRTDATAEMVRGFFADFPDVSILEGWVPDVFERADETQFALVHVDLTLFDATLAALEYCYPRLSAGGVMLCDGSLFCPGVEKAVDRFAQRCNVPYVSLGHRQFVFLKA